MRFSEHCTEDLRDTELKRVTSQPRGPQDQANLCAHTSERLNERSQGGQAEKEKSKVLGLLSRCQGTAGTRSP